MTAISEKPIAKDENVSDRDLKPAQRRICFQCASSGSPASPCLKGISRQSIVDMSDNREECNLKTLLEFP